MAGGRRMMSINKAVAVAMAVALLALLFAAGEAGKQCNVDEGTVLMQCRSACSGGGEPQPSHECCEALKSADYGCLCQRYKNQLKNTSGCFKAIPSKCNPNAPKSC